MGPRLPKPRRVARRPHRPRHPRPRPKHRRPARPPRPPTATARRARRRANRGPGCAAARWSAPAPSRIHRVIRSANGHEPTRCPGARQSDALGTPARVGDHHRHRRWPDLGLVRQARRGRDRRGRSRAARAGARDSASRRRHHPKHPCRGGRRGRRRRAVDPDRAGGHRRESRGDTHSTRRPVVAARTPGGRGQRRGAEPARRCRRAAPGGRAFGATDLQRTPQRTRQHAVGAAQPDRPAWAREPRTRGQEKGARHRPCLGAAHRTIEGGCSCPGSQGNI